VVSQGDIEGWVFNAYLQPAPPAGARRRAAPKAAKRSTSKPAPQASRRR
jgi:hypothetical protein